MTLRMGILVHVLWIQRRRRRNKEEDEIELFVGPTFRTVGVTTIGVEAIKRGYNVIYPNSVLFKGIFSFLSSQPNYCHVLE